MPVELVQDFVEIPAGKEQGWDLPDVKTPDGQNLIDVATTPHSRDCSVQILDLNGDGIPDITYWFIRKGVDIADTDIDAGGGQTIKGKRVKRTRSKDDIKGAWLGGAKGWVAANSYTPPHRLDESEDNPRLSYQLIDVNGDGLPDFVFTEKTPDSSSKCQTYINNGNGWEPPCNGWETVSDPSKPNWAIPVDAIGSGEGDQGYRLIDVSGDGLVNVIFYKVEEDGSIRRGAYVNTGVGWKREDRFAQTFP